VRKTSRRPSTRPETSITVALIFSEGAQRTRKDVSTARAANTSVRRSTRPVAEPRTVKASRQNAAPGRASPVDFGEGTARAGLMGVIAGF
jgi:hypothetical protein